MTAVLPKVTPPRLRAFFLLTGPALILGLALAPGAGAGAGGGKVGPPPTTGEQIYKQMCASCHGAKGEGGPGYAKPLTGTRSVGELAGFIGKAMPPGPHHATPAQAQKVAAYLFDAFYSPIAQERNRPARIALSRLTVRQYRNAVMDLVNFSPPVLPAEAKHGLDGQYFLNRNFDPKERGLRRLDPEIKFDFGTGGPADSGFDPHHFCASWDGSVFAPDSGEYEFIVRTDHAARLYVNGGPKPLIDAWIKSGKDTEFHGFVTLVGGRTYPLRLEFSKSTYGVDDSEQKKGKPAPKAFLELAWKRPKMAAEIIPARCLYPAGVSSRVIVTTPFPPDDRSMGYERGSSVSKAWDEATTTAALETAAYVGSHIAELTGVPDNAPDRKERLQKFCRGFVERAFRRPLTPDAEFFYVRKQFGNAPDADSAVKRVVLLTLVSPRFLYREVDGPPNDPYNVASRLSFGLWDTIPDGELWRAAGAGELATPEGVRRQAERMAADPRAWNTVRDFLLFWLKVDQVPDIAKNRKAYPDFDATTAADLRTSLELGLQNTVCSPSSDYRDLMLSRTLYLNGRLAKLYGVNLPADAPFQPVEMPTGERAGVLTHPYLLSRFAYLDTSSPIHRGVLIVRNLLGRVLNPPPAAFVPLPASAHPDWTTRQRVSVQTQPAACASCHGMINPLGFTLEEYDAIGRVRQSENGKPIDATGTYLARDGKKVAFSNAQDLARYLADSEESQTAFVEKLFHHLVKQPALAYGPRTLPGLEQRFRENGCNIRKLMVDIAVVTALPPAGNPRNGSLSETPSAPPRPGAK